MAKEFAAMEEAATKAYQEDLKRLGVKAESVGQPSVPKKQEEKKEKKEKKKKGKQTRGISSNGTKEWVQGFSPEGYTYYYNTISGESQWEKPEGFRDTSQNSQKAAVWVEGTNNNGCTYYYNKETGVSTWEKPEGFVSPSVKNNPGENHSEEVREMSAEEAKSDAGKRGSKNELQKPKRALQRKTDSDEEIKEKPHKPKKVSPYGEWREVRQDTMDHEKSPSVPQETSQTSSQKATPYGKWEEITEEDPYENVDLELPSSEGDNLPAPVLEVPEDAKVIFKEKTVASLGDSSEGTPVFKKRKLENGKSRNIRQRPNDH